MSLDEAGAHSPIQQIDELCTGWPVHSGRDLADAVVLDEYRRRAGQPVGEDGASAEILVVGNEGLIGVALFMGGETTLSRAIVQSAGYAYRLIGQKLKDEFHRNGELQRYTQALLMQMAQTAVCNRHHSVEQPLCRWLLSSLDRLPSNQLAMTQELIADMLGVRREGVTEGAGKLQKIGVIRYIRGRITVLNRPRLEQPCCECSAVVKREIDRLLPALGPTRRPAGRRSLARGAPRDRYGQTARGRQVSGKQVCSGHHRTYQTGDLDRREIRERVADRVGQDDAVSLAHGAARIHDVRDVALAG